MANGVSLAITMARPMPMGKNPRMTLVPTEEALRARASEQTSAAGKASGEPRK